MASITFTRNLKSDSSDLISAYNNNIFLISFTPTDETKDITVKIEVGGVTFNCYHYDTTGAGTIFHFRIDLLEIIRYFLYDFYFKAVSANINLSNLVRKREFEILGYEDAVETDDNDVELYISHAVNQIGYEYGGNVRYLYDNEDLKIIAFNEFPFELYFYKSSTGICITTLNGVFLLIDESVTEGLNTLKHASLDVEGENEVLIYNGGTEKITGWTNDGDFPWTILTATGKVMTEFANSGVEDGLAYTNEFAIVAGTTYLIYLSLEDEDVSVLPVFGIGESADIPNLGSTKGEDLTIAWGDNFIAYLATATGNRRLYLRVFEGDDEDISGDISLTNLITTQKIELDVKDSLCDGVYVRYLSKEGFYRYWLFNKYYKYTSQGSKIGEIIPYMDTMVSSQGRTKNIGYEKVFESMLVTSENVSKADQKLLMDIYTSPAVYFWLGEREDVSDEAEWLLVNIAGTHEIIEKKNFQKVQATIIKPEKYTQKL